MKYPKYQTCYEYEEGMNYCSYCGSNLANQPETPNSEQVKRRSSSACSLGEGDLKALIEERSYTAAAKIHAGDNAWKRSEIIAAKMKILYSEIQAANV